jgi:HEPN domain-containing protein
MDEAKRALVRDWMTRANHDLQAARRLTASDDALLDVAIYHCQQAGEKSVKAWLESRNQTVRKTHHVADLVREAAAIDGSFATLLTAAAVLTPYASAFRYPAGAYEPMPTREEFDEALAHAQTIFDFVCALLPVEARP